LLNLPNITVSTKIEQSSRLETEVHSGTDFACKCTVINSLSGCSALRRTKLQFLSPFSQRIGKILFSASLGCHWRSLQGWSDS